MAARHYLLAALLHLVSAQTGTTATVGIGTILIIVAVVFSIFWCLICRSSSRPELYSIGGILFPILLIIIFIFMPKEKDKPATTETTDLNFATHIAFLVVSILTFLMTILFVCIDYFFTDKKAKNIARSAFVMKDEEEESLTKKSRVMGSRQGSEPHMRVQTSQSNK